MLKLHRMSPPSGGRRAVRKRAPDAQLRIADMITAFAGSMTFVYLHVPLSRSGC